MFFLCHLKFHSAFHTPCNFQNDDSLRCIECSEEDFQCVASTSLSFPLLLEMRD